MSENGTFAIACVCATFVLLAGARWCGIDDTVARQPGVRAQQTVLCIESCARLRAEAPCFRACESIAGARTSTTGGVR